MVKHNNLITNHKTTWLSEYYCLFFFEFLLLSPLFLLHFLLSILLTSFLSNCTSLHAFISKLSCAFLNSFSPFLLNLSHSHFPSLWLLSDIFLALSCFSKLLPLHNGLPPLPMLYPDNSMSTYTHICTHTESNVYRCLILYSIFPSPAHFEISMLVYLFHWQD